MRIPRSRGAVSGLLLMILGAWGALVPFIGPYFDLVVGPDDTWNWSSDRFWLSVLPGIVAFVGGLILLQSAHRGGASLGAWMGIAAGAWFTLGPLISRLWTADGASALGQPAGGTNRQVLELLVMYAGLGVLMAAIAAFALGRLAVRSVRDVELAEEAELEPARRERDGMTTGVGRSPTATATACPTTRSASAASRSPTAGRSPQPRRARHAPPRPRPPRRSTTTASPSGASRRPTTRRRWTPRVRSRRPRPRPSRRAAAAACSVACAASERWSRPASRVLGVTDSPIRDGWSFCHVDRVRFADLDAMRHLNNVAFLTFFESARIAYVTALLTDYQPEQRDAFGLIVAEVHIDYRSPAYYDEEIHTWLRPASIARSAFRTEFEMRSGRDDRLLAEGYAVLVGFDYGIGKSMPLPDDLRAALTESAVPATAGGPLEADPRADLVAH